MYCGRIRIYSIARGVGQEAGAEWGKWEERKKAKVPQRVWGVALKMFRLHPEHRSKLRKGQRLLRVTQRVCTSESRFRKQRETGLRGSQSGVRGSGLEWCSLTPSNLLLPGCVTFSNHVSKLRAIKLCQTVHVKVPSTRSAWHRG